MNRGIDHGDVFFADSDRVEFGQRLADVHERFGVRTHAYCLMDNHYHLLWHCPDGGLSAAMQRLGSLYTRHVNDRLGRDGALFRGRFHSRLVTDERHLCAAVRYIHRNALDLPGVTNVRDHRWSSHRTYLGLRRCPPWLDTTHVLGRWDVDAFDRFVHDDVRPLKDSSEPMIRSLIAATELVLVERGLRCDARLGASARRIVLAWASETRTASEEMMMSALGIDNARAFQRAAQRAAASMRAEPEFRAVLSRALDLLADTTATTRV